MTHEELIAGIESKLRGLRACDTQATAVAWMAGAYKLMEECLLHLKDQAAAPPVRLVFAPEPPKLTVVQSVPKPEQIGLYKAFPRYSDKTVVYPETFLHPGLKPAPKAWTRADTLRLERAVKAKQPAVQRRGR